jgi:hypothetical protein
VGCNASRRRRIKEIGKGMEETTNDSDRMFLLSLLPVIKQLSGMDNLGFRVEDQEKPSTSSSSRIPACYVPKNSISCPIKGANNASS